MPRFRRRRRRREIPDPCFSCPAQGPTIFSAYVGRVGCFGREG
jgi:hypothetical protein